ncbi:ImmA/IrrE family metallo-endopeptidase [Methylobacterium terricola]|uniref:ImmA/IrrE family metallo-endopeptidase n=1 Tax=Methylobacterium terricola TaxID=2583531 RepID=A0A5C4LFA5_9HYPH|nr:ImmA/IrrE family metallo-endopeptidase [Methylobacterium terricola]TNC12672.1 ImmA/IrrE family metallo-endopeptidase [Methylobacterium terricola]
MARFRTNEELERLARETRVKLGLENQDRIDMMTVIQKLKAAYPGFQYAREPDEILPDAEAQWDSSKRVIRLRESVFRAMQRGEPRARMTTSHEIAHFLLGHEGIRNRSLVKTAAERFANEVKREESEARRLAPMLLAPSYLVKSEDTVDEISRRFGISLEAAAIRREEVSALERQASGDVRPLPQVVIDFLREAKRRGQTVRTDVGE